MRNLYDSVIALFKCSIIYERAEQGIQKEPLSNDESKLETKDAEEADIEKEAVFEFKNAIESIYEALSEELQDLTIDEGNDNPGFPLYFSSCQGIGTDSDSCQ